MVAAALRLKLNLKLVNMHEQEHLRPTYLRISPHHMVPTLVDNEFSMFESRAICIYLVEKYGKNDALYPRNAKTRATINQLMYFDMGTLFKRFFEYYYPIYQGADPEPQKWEALQEAMGFLDNFLTDKKFAVTYRLTIVDLILLSTVSTIETAGFDLSSYKHVSNWYSNLKAVAPGYDKNVEGLEAMKAMMKQMMMKNEEANAAKSAHFATAEAATEEIAKTEKKAGAFEQIKFDISDDGKVVVSKELRSPGAETPSVQAIVTPAFEAAIQSAVETPSVQAIVTPAVEIPSVQAIVTPAVEITPTPEVKIVPTPAAVETLAVPMVEIIEPPIQVIESEISKMEVIEPTKSEVTAGIEPLIEITKTETSTPVVEITKLTSTEVVTSPTIEIVQTSSTIEIIKPAVETIEVVKTSSSEEIIVNSSSEVVTEVREVITTTKVVQSETTVETTSEIVNGIIVENGSVKENGEDLRG